MQRIERILADCSSHLEVCATNLGDDDYRESVTVLGLEAVTVISADIRQIRQNASSR